jgi:osmoprotectant transport system substrate-binding protein
MNGRTTNGTALRIIASAAVLTAALAACGSPGSSNADAASTGSGSVSTNTIGSRLILGGPSEFATRPEGIPGLKKLYGVGFQQFKILDAGGPLTINALKNGQIDAGDIFTTDPSIKAYDFVVLSDPESLYAAQNVTPLISKSKATPGVTSTLDAVSAKLTTEALISLNEKVITEKQAAGAVAKEWLADVGLDGSGDSASGVNLTIGSANFPESSTLAEIYAAALEAQGAKVKTKLNIGSRETYVPGLQDGSIDLIPEYSGALLSYLDKKATAVSSVDVYTALKKTMPAKLTVLDQSEAQDKDAIVVTRVTADKYHLTSIADLAKKS